jgi:hypothetical protein
VRHRFALQNPQSLLHLFRNESLSINFDEVDEAQVWALAGLAALSRDEARSISVQLGGSTSGRFAEALGFRSVCQGDPPNQTSALKRTFKLRRFRLLDEVPSLAADIAQLVVPDTDSHDAQRTVQHAHDSLGGVVAAQRMDEGFKGYAKSVVQVVVADAGVGIWEALRGHHPSLGDANAALMKSIEPHISGTFHEGLTGTAWNAGMGLFMLSEIAKHTAGRMLIASRGAAITIQGDLENESKPRFEFVPPPSTGFPGTLVAFELPLENVHNHEGLVELIREKARTRTPQRDASQWIRLEVPPKGTKCFPVLPFREDVARAQKLARETLMPMLLARESFELDFVNVTFCTQSFAHALLFEVSRVSWALKVPIYVTNAAPAVTTAIRFVDSYAQGG